MPLISVIVPVYKVEAYIHRCINSILLQTISDFDLVLVDDGSPDNCGSICDEYAAKDKRIHVIHQENSGLSAARNAGIDWVFKNSNSQYLAFIDSDDWVHPSFLENLVRGVKENNTKISACNFLVAETKSKYVNKEYVSEIINWDDFYIRETVPSVVAWNKLYSRELFMDIRYPVGKLHEDEFLTYKLLYLAKQITWIPLDLYFYYKNETGIIKSTYSLKRLDAIEALAEQREFAKSIDNKEFYLKVSKRYLYNLNQHINSIKESKTIGEIQKKKAIRKLQTKMREVLITDGKYIAPIKEKRSYYEEAFPKLTWLYWTLRGIMNKLIR